MNRLCSRLGSYLVAPATAVPVPAEPAEAARAEAVPEHALQGAVLPAEAKTAPPPREPSAPSGRSRSARRPPGAGSGIGIGIGVVGVVGGRDAAALAVDLSCALATAGRHPCGVVALWGAPATVPPRGHPTRAADQLASHLTATCGGPVPVARGRGVVVTLASDPAEAAAAYGAVAAAVEGAGVLVLALCGPRSGAFDGVLARQAVLVLVVGAGALTGLSGLAEASLREIAPAAALVTVTSPSGSALPRPLRHRPAIRHVLGAIS